MKTSKLIKTFDKVESIIPTIENQELRQRLENYNYELWNLILNHSIKWDK